MTKRNDLIEELRELEKGLYEVLLPSVVPNLARDWYFMGVFEEEGTPYEVWSANLKRGYTLVHNVRNPGLVQTVLDVFFDSELIYDELDRRIAEGRYISGYDCIDRGIPYGTPTD